MKIIAYFYLLFCYRSVQCALPIFHKTTVLEREPFTIVCDHLRCDGVPENVTGFSNIGILKTTPNSETNMTTFAYIVVYAPNADAHKSRIPDGRNWKASFHSNNRSDNRFIINVSLTVMDTRVEDSGQYFCNLMYFNNGISECSTSDWLIVSNASLDTSSKDSKVGTESPRDPLDETPYSNNKKSPPGGERTTKGAPKNHGHFIFTREIQEVVGCYFIWLAAWLR